MNCHLYKSKPGRAFFERKIMKKKKNKNNWVIIVTILAFFISLLFSSLSQVLMPKVHIVIGVIILLFFITLGIVFDMVGVAVTASNEEPLHAMNSKKIKGAKKAVNFKKNADKVSSFCNDVIGDICGIISGSAGVAISTTLSKILNINIFYTGLLITALIASLTIGGKAYCKRIAISNSHKIVYKTAKIISFFERK